MGEANFSIGDIRTITVVACATGIVLFVAFMICSVYGCLRKAGVIKWDERKKTKRQYSYNVESAEVKMGLKSELDD